MDNHGAPDGGLHTACDLLRLDGHGTRSGRESREILQGVEGEGRC